MNMYKVYVLQSESDGRLYYGFTKNLNQRIKEHNEGRVISTRSRIPLKLVYNEDVESVEAARKREKYFKSGYGRKYIHRKLKNAALSSNG